MKRMDLRSRLFGTLAISVAVLIPGVVEAQQAADPPPPPATQLPVRRAWTSDRLTLQPGDIITILVDEYLLASANKDLSASREKDRDLGLSANTGSGSSGFNLRTRNDVGNRERGESSRQQRVLGEISARVMEITPSGMLRIEGTKKLQIDDVEEDVTVRGWIRPQDLSLDNTVESWRLGEAELLYASNGTLGKTGGFWSKLLDWIWP